MGRNVTLAEVRTKVQARYDLPAFTTNTYVSTDYVTEFINSSIASYVGLLMECEAEEYYTYEDDLTTTPGQAYVLTTSLSSAQFQGLRDIHWVRGANDTLPLKRATREEWRMRSWSSSDWWSTHPRYRLIRDRIYFGPPPAGTETLRITYTGIPAALSSTSDTFYAGPGWEEWVVADVCRKIAEREDQDPSRFMAARDRAEAGIRGQMYREEAGPEMVRRMLVPHGIDPEEELFG